MTRSAAERSLRNCLSAALSGTLLLGSLPANAVVKQPLPVRLDAPRAKATLLLDRFTFGIRPGDIDTVTREGVDAWFDNQLDPSRVDDSALEQRLDVYPALRMTQTARLARYPEPNSIRQMARTGALPSDPEARAIVRNQVEFYQMAQQNKAANGVAARAAAPVVRMTPGGMQQPVTVAPSVSATADAAKVNAAAAADLKN